MILSGRGNTCKIWKKDGQLFATHYFTNSTFTAFDISTYIHTYVYISDYNIGTCDSFSLAPNAVHVMFEETAYLTLAC